MSSIRLTPLHGISRRYNTLAICLSSLVTSCLVFGLATLSILAVQSLRAFCHLVLQLIALLAEAVVAVVAALASGLTVSIVVVLATGVSSFVYPSSCIAARLCLSACASVASVFACCAALGMLANVQANAELLSTMVLTAATSVAVASTWATAILSLIERETQNNAVQRSSIMDAVQKNRYLFLKFLLKIRYIRDQDCLDIALLLAVKANFIECARVLLQAGANVNTRDTSSNTPLLIACDQGHTALAALLLEHGALVDIVNDGGASPLHNAAKSGFAWCASMLIIRGANVNQTDSLMRSPLMLACKYAQPTEPVVKLLLEASAEVNLVGHEHYTALHYAAARGECVMTLLNVGARYDVKDSAGNTPLHLASHGGHAKAVEILLGWEKVDLHCINNRHQTALHLAASSGDIECIKFLLIAKFDVCSVDMHILLPLCNSVLNGHKDAVKLLLKHNSPVGPFTSSKGKHITATNPIFSALQNRHFELVKLLLFAGCSEVPLRDWLNDWHKGSHDLYQEQVDWFNDFLRNPRDLMSICRIKIRALFHPGSANASSTLPIPRLMKKYIDFDEI